jgi:hypothetical protein
MLLHKGRTVAVFSLPRDSSGWDVLNRPLRMMPMNGARSCPFLEDISVIRTSNWEGLGDRSETVERRQGTAESFLIDGRENAVPGR